MRHAAAATAILLVIIRRPGCYSVAIAGNVACFDALTAFWLLPLFEGRAEDSDDPHGIRTIQRRE